MFIAFLYMFQATMCPSSGENTVPMRTWYLSLCIDDCLVCRAEFIPPRIPDSHLYRVTNTRCRKGTVFSPDDGHIVARNIQGKAINILRKFVHEDGSVYEKKYHHHINIPQSYILPTACTALIRKALFLTINSDYFHIVHEMNGFWPSQKCEKRL